MNVINERTWVEIDKRALVHNALAFHKHAGKSLLMAVIKSNAYGHGIIECSKILNKKVEWFGVDDLDEALALRKFGIKKPILVLGFTLAKRFLEAKRHNVSLTVASLDSLESVPRGLDYHLKLETGLNRQGVTHEELPAALAMIEKQRTTPTGIYSHFAAAELAQEDKYKKFCNMQMGKFEEMAERVEKFVGKALIKHMAGTAATLLLPESRYDLVRVGIGMYGLDPTSSIKLPLVKKFGLKPIMDWYAVIAQVKSVKKSERIGYDLTEMAKKNIKVAIVPVGYWQGYPRALSSVGEVIVKNVLCKVMGRISMDMMIVDITAVPKVKSGDIVTLIGAGMSAEEVAQKAGTVNYEIVTRINPQTKHVII